MNIRSKADIDGRPEKVFRSPKKICLEMGLWNVIQAYAYRKSLSKSEVVELGMKQFLKDSSVLLGEGQ